MSQQSVSFNYPIVLHLQDRLAVVVGAGSVGRRKVQRLLQAGARVRVIDPILTDGQNFSAGVESFAREFSCGDLQGAELVFACTDSATVNQRVCALARQQRILCCRADLPQDGDFSLPAVLEKGRLRLAVSTSGASPALAAEFRDRLAAQIPDWWDFALEVAAAVRQKWLTGQIDDKYNQEVLRNFLAESMLPLLEDGKLSEINKLLIETFGCEFSLEQLKVQLPEGMV